MKRRTSLLLAGLVIIPAAAVAQVTCTKTTRLVTIADGACSTTYAVATIRCADGTCTPRLRRSSARTAAPGSPEPLKEKQIGPHAETGAAEGHQALSASTRLW